MTDAPSPPTGPGAPARRHSLMVVLLVVCIGQFMVVLDVSVVNVALPAIQRNLGFTEANLQWVVTAYALTFGGLLLLGGRLADLFGRRRIFLVGLGLFTVASIAGGLAQNQTTLVAARALQGVGGAILSPATLTIITVTFTENRARARALGVWSAVAAGGGAAGALFGGVLTDLLSWRWILFINVPIGIAAIVIARVVIDESHGSGERQPLDVAGALTVTAGLVALVYGIVRTDQVPWGSAQTIGTLALAAVLLGAFVLIEARLASHPLVPLRMFASRALSGANASMFCFGAAMFGMWFFLTLYLQQVLGFSPLTTGYAFLPQTAAIAVAATVAGRLAPRIGPRPVIVVGALLAASGLFWLSFIGVGQSYWDNAFWGGVMSTFGMGLAFTPIALAATAGVRAHEAGLASGLVNTARQIGAAVGLAVLSTVVADHIRTDLALPRHGPVAASAAQARAIHAELVKTVSASGYAHGFAIAAGVALAGAVIALVIPALPKRPVAAVGAERLAALPVPAPEPA